MKRSTIITLACSALVATGCSHRTHQARYESTTTSAPLYGGTSTTYNEQINNQRSVDNRYKSSTDLSNPQSSTTYNQSSIETTPADNILIQQVRSAINNDTTLVSIAPSIQVSAQGGTVTLSGNVQNEDQKRAIERAAKGTTGVVTVNNQLQVSGSANQSSQIQSGQSQTGGSQSSLYPNSSRQSQGSISGGVGASSTGSVGASADLKGSETNDAAQSGPFGKDSSSGATSRRLYSTKDDLGTNGLNSAQGTAGESSLGSTNSSNSSSLNSTNDSSSSAQGGATSIGGSTSGASGATDKSSSGTSSPNDDSSSLNSTNNSSASPQGGTSSSFNSGSSSSLGSSADKSSSAGSTSLSDQSASSSASSPSSSQGESKDLSATASGQSSRIYSTNQTDQSSGGSLSSADTTSNSGDSLSLSVQGATESDQKLADQLRQELRSDSSVSGAMSHLRISLNNGKATLRGTVKSDQEKQDIEKSVQKVTGVTSVQNELRVSSSGQSGADENK